MQGHDVDVTIRRASLHDTDEVVRQRVTFLRHMRGGTLDRAAELSALTRTFVQEESTAGRMHTWLAESGGECIGIISMLLWARPPRPHDRGARDAYIINMFVAPAHVGHGVGRRLLAACIATADEFEIGKFFLHASDDGRPLYESAGFQANPAWLEWTALPEAPDAPSD